MVSKWRGLRELVEPDEHERKVEDDPGTRERHEAWEAVRVPPASDLASPGKDLPTP